jgi:ADP-heptose:LPS heptosyltransferase
MTIPLVRAVARLRGARVTIIARTQAIGDVFRGMPGLERIEVLAGHDLGAWRRHRRIQREHRPDIYLVPYPSNRWQYSLLAAGSGAGRVIMHSYPTGRLRALRFIPRMLKSTTFVPAVRGIHDAVQNLRLLRPLGSADGQAEPAEARIDPPMMHVDDADRSAAASELQRTGVSGPFIALQPGCGDTLIGAAKRWPAENFARLADTLSERGHNVLVIEGPDERGVGRQVSELSRSRPPVIELSGPLGHAAALLEMAQLYVGNDSGLAHVAAAVGTPPVTLFAAGDPVRVAPFGFEHLVVTPPAVNGRAWQPRLLYPIDYPKPRLTDAGGIDWASHIRHEDVLAAIERASSRHRSRGALQFAQPRV